MLAEAAMARPEVRKGLSNLEKEEALGPFVDEPGWLGALRGEAFDAFAEGLPSELAQRATGRELLGFPRQIVGNGDGCPHDFFRTTACIRF